MIYTHVLNLGPAGVRSPVDRNIRDRNAARVVEKYHVVGLPLNADVGRMA